ncbi:sulfite exporter TauE/SafE family protein [Guyparkeria sp. GHLCS8-2]|uniref:sulfite exporter TauE/SafE family protein n=1 Tax=Guyparkeria halopsychrophila TaxID=3139421 RepID=UPI0037CACA5E
MEYLLFAILGIVGGVAAGLLGIGGGLIMVPVLLMIFPTIGISGPHLVHIAIGTSLAAIVFASITSVYSHHRHGGVLWGVFARFAPGMALGAILGSTVAHYLPGNVLKIVFGVLEIAVALQMAFGKAPPASRQLPGIVPLTGVSSSFGAIASIMGMGGGAMTTPFFLYCNITARNAIATSASLTLPTALFGAAGYVVSGWTSEGLPEMTAGYVYLPAVAGIAVFSVLFAPIGAKLAQILPARTLKRIFAFVLVGLGIHMILS